MNEEQLNQIRAKYNIPSGGYGKSKSVFNESPVDMNELDSLWGTEVKTEAPRATATDFAIGAGKGAIETLQNIGNIVAKPLGKAMGVPEEEIGIPKEKLEADNTAQKVGKFTERVAEVAVPATKISTATKTLPFISRVVTRTLADMGIMIAQEGEIKAKEQGAISLASQAIPSVLKIGGKYLSNIFKRGAGVLTSKGSEVVEQVLKDPELAMKGMEGNPVQTLRSAASSVVDFIKNLSKSAKETYGETIQNIEKNYQEVISGFRSSQKDGMTLIHPETGTTIIKDPNGNKFNLALGTLKKYITNGLKDFNVTGSTKGGFDFSNSSLNPQEEAVMGKVVDKIQNWTDITPTGLNRLSQIVEGYARAESAGLKRANAIIYRIANTMDDYIAERVPGIREMNNEYKQSMQFIQQLENQVGQITGKAVTPELIDQVSKKISNLFTANKQIARDVISKMPGGEDLLSIEAGREMVQSIGRASAGLGGKIEGLVQAVIPPERVAKLTAFVGKQGKKLDPILPVLEKLVPTERAVLIETMLNLFED